MLVGYHLLSCYLRVLLLSTVVKCRNSVHVYQFFDRVTKSQKWSIKCSMLGTSFRDQLLIQKFGNHVTSYCKQCHFPLTIYICYVIYMLRLMSQIHSHTGMLLHPQRMLCFCIYLSICLSVHRITQKVVDKLIFWRNFNRRLLINFVMVWDISLTKKKHSI